jgi:choline dehydrogenase-like flavoprotein
VALRFAAAGRPTPERQFGEFNASLGGWTLDGEPYTTAGSDQFHWFRSRMLGGRTNHWGRISLRYGPNDFRRKSIDGLGDDWPITYDDIKPYYDKVDTLVGIFGSKEGLPNDPDGLFQPAPRPRCYELLIKRAADRLKITCIASRLSILTQPLNGRPACHYCGQCGRGCSAHANFSSPSVLLPPALATEETDDDHQRDGARGDGRRERPCRRRRVHRQDHGPRQSRARTNRRRGGERL